MKVFEHVLRRIIRKELLEVLDSNKKIPKERDRTGEDAILQFNIDKLIDLGFLKFIQREDLVADVAYLRSALWMVAPLNETRIKKVVAKGTQGVVYSLENGKLLKLFKGGYRGGGSERSTQNVAWEADRYSSIESRSHSGQSYKGELSVYGSGMVNMRGTSIGWVEMGRVLIFFEYLGIITNFDYRKMREISDLVENFIAATVRKFMNQFMRPGSFIYIGNFDNVEDLFQNSDFIENIFQSQNYTDIANELGLEFAQDLVTAIFKLYFKTGKNLSITTDLHTGNFGVESLFDPTPVIFDI